MANYTTTITNEGAALLASVIANQGTLTFNEFRFSENDYTGQESTLTEGTFLGVFITASAAASVIDSTTIKTSAQFNNSTITGNHNLYSIGIVGTDGNTTALIAVCTTTDPDVIREPLTGTSTYAFNVNLSVSDTSQINVFGTTAAVLYDVDVVDTLISTATDKPLSANQGRVLEQQAEAGFNVLGAKNLGIPLEDLTYLNLSTSNNSDGSLTVTTNGLACGGINSNWSSPFILKKGTYQVSFGLDTDETPSLTGFAVILKVFSTSYWLCTSGDSVASRKITLATDTEVVWGLYCETSTVVATQTVYPMIRPASIVDPTFAPYAKTNQQLTADKAERSDLATLKLTGSTNSTGSTISSGTFFYLNGRYCKAKTNIANGATFTLNTNYEEVTVGGEISSINDNLLKKVNYANVQADADDFLDGVTIVSSPGSVSNLPESGVRCVIQTYTVLDVPVRKMQMCQTMNGNLHIRECSGGTWGTWAAH